MLRLVLVCFEIVFMIVYLATKIWLLIRGSLVRAQEEEQKNSPHSIYVMGVFYWCNFISIYYFLKALTDFMFAHNNSQRSTYTSKYRPWVMVALFSIGNTRAEALATERFIKMQKIRRLLCIICHCNNRVAFSIIPNDPVNALLY